MPYIHTPKNSAVPHVIAQGKRVSKAVIKFLISNQITNCILRDSEHEPINDGMPLVIT